MLRFLPVTLVQKMHVPLVIGNLIHDYIVRVIQVFTGPDLHLFHKLDPLVLGRLADGKDVIKKVV